MIATKEDAGAIRASAPSQLARDRASTAERPFVQRRQASSPDIAIRDAPCRQDRSASKGVTDAALLRRYRRSMVRRLAWVLTPALIVSMFAACEESSTSEPTTPDAGGLPPLDGSSQSDAPSSPDTGPGSEGGADGGADADVPPLTPDYFVDPAAGADTNDGKTKATAWKTLCKAKDVVQANQVVGLVDGAYDNANQRPPNWNLNPPCGPTFNVAVRLTALNPTKAVVKVPVVLAAGGEVRGLKFDYDADSRGTLSSSAGTLVIRDVSYGSIFSPPNAKGPALSVSGTAKVTVFPGAVTNYTTVPVPDGTALIFAFVTGNGELTMEGGTFDDSTVGNADSFCAPLFEGSGKITLKGVTVRHKGTIVRATGTTLSVTGGTLDDRSTPFNTGCLPSIDLSGSVNATFKDVTFGGGGQRAFGTDTFASGTLALTNVTLTGFTDYAINLNAFDNQPLAFSMRGSTVKNNAVGIRVFGGVAADLGTVASLGNNVIDANTTRGLENGATAIVNAAGNTWTANQQGAGADGKYAASLETGPAAGVNYSLATAAQQIQF